MGLFPRAITGTSYTFTGLATDTTYSFTARAKYCNHASDYSSPFVVRARGSCLLENGRYSFRAVVSSSKLLDLDKSSSNVQIWDNHSGANQQ